MINLWRNEGQIHVTGCCNCDAFLKQLLAYFIAFRSRQREIVLPFFRSMGRRTLSGKIYFYFSHSSLPFPPKVLLAFNCCNLQMRDQLSAQACYVRFFVSSFCSRKKVFADRFYSFPYPLPLSLNLLLHYSSPCLEFLAWSSFATLSPCECRT